MKRKKRWIMALALGAGVCLGTLLIAQGCRNSAPPAGSLGTPATRTAQFAPAQRLVGLTVKPADVRNKKGHLIFGVFTSAEGFPSDPLKAVYWETRSADSENLTFECMLPPGRYSASILHDENSNGQMDVNFLGIPKEGYGVTNNPKPKYSAATFQQGIFELGPDGKDLAISIQYFQ